MQREVISIQYTVRHSLSSQNSSTFSSHAQISYPILYERSLHIFISPWPSFTGNLLSFLLSDEFETPQLQQFPFVSEKLGNYKHTGIFNGLPEQPLKELQYNEISNNCKTLFISPKLPAIFFFDHILVKRINCTNHKDVPVTNFKPVQLIIHWNLPLFLCNINFCIK